MKEYLRNAWYMAGWSEEVTDGLLGRQLLGIPVVLFRDTAGAATALVDRCPHRFAPLSRGRKEEGGIRCGYHGLRFDAGGRCVHSPLSADVPNARVQPFPVIERHSILWLWPGDPRRADPHAIPDFAFLEDSPTNRVIRGLLPMNAHYELGTDNLMDLSHIEFLHTGSFAGDGVIFAGRHNVVQEAETVSSNWWMPDIPLPSGARRGQFPLDTRVDHWLEMRWNAPAAMYLEVGSTPTGRSRSDGDLSRQAHILTPEGDGTTHYFWAAARTTMIDSAELDAEMKAVLTKAFVVEDKPMIEAVQRNMQGADLWAMRPVILPTDAGSVRARRLLAKMIRDENGAGGEIAAL